MNGPSSGLSSWVKAISSLPHPHHFMPAMALSLLSAAAWSELNAARLPHRGAAERLRAVPRAPRGVRTAEEDS